MGQTQLHYEMILEFGESSMRDVNYCAFIRSPIIKQASFCIVEVFMSQVLARQLRSDLARNKYPDIKLLIYVDDEVKKNKLQNIYSNTLKCIEMKTDSVIRFEEDRIHVTLLLVHPILYYMGNNNTFNQLFVNTTASNVLGEFESFLTNKFGDIFNFNHIGTDTHKNNHRYRQLLTRAPNDLSVPDYLIQNYKVNNSFCYYFYDMFHIADDSTNEICCNHINLYDQHNFHQVDVQEFFDKQLAVNHIESRGLSDVFHKITNKKGNRFIFRDSNIRADYQKNPQITMLNKKHKPIEQEFELAEGRKIKSLIGRNMTSTSYFGSSAISSLYCPDNIHHGQLRFDHAVELSEDKLLQIEIYEMSNCLPDFPQFNHIYNLEDYNETNFNHVPISIVNIFKRKNFREQYLYHLAKTALIRYKNL